MADTEDALERVSKVGTCPRPREGALWLRNLAILEGRGRSRMRGKNPWTYCSVFLKVVSFKKTLVYEKWFAESYVRVYADFMSQNLCL